MGSKKSGDVAKERKASIGANRPKSAPRGPKTEMYHLQVRRKWGPERLHGGQEVGGADGLSNGRLKQGVDSQSPWVGYVPFKTRGRGGLKSTLRTLIREVA